MRRREEPNTDVAWRVLEGVHEWIKVADSKAVAAVTGSGVLAGLVLKALPAFGTHRVHPWHFWLLLASVIVASLAALAGLSVVTPHLRNRAKGKSHLFFGDIAKVKSPTVYRKQVQALATDSNVVLDEVANQVWMTSRIARTKHFRVALSLRLLSLALLVAGVASLVRGH